MDWHLICHYCECVCRKSSRKIDLFSYHFNRCELYLIICVFQLGWGFIDVNMMREKNLIKVAFPKGKHQRVLGCIGTATLVRPQNFQPMKKLTLRSISPIQCAVNRWKILFHFKISPKSFAVNPVSCIHCWIALNRWHIFCKIKIQNVYECNLRWDLKMI